VGTRPRVLSALALSITSSTRPEICAPDVRVLAWPMMVDAAGSWELSRSVPRRILPQSSPERESLGLTPCCRERSHSYELSFTGELGMRTEEIVPGLYSIG
jgi:hypothetical protein